MFQCFNIGTRSVRFKLQFNLTGPQHSNQVTHELKLCVIIMIQLLQSDGQFHFLVACFFTDHLLLYKSHESQSSNLNFVSLVQVAVIKPSPPCTLIPACKCQTNLLHVHVTRRTPLLSHQGPGDEASTATYSTAGELVQVSPTTPYHPALFQITPTLVCDGSASEKGF